jgi:hypothetical protein
VFGFQFPEGNAVMALRKTASEIPVHGGEIEITDLAKEFSVVRKYGLLLALDSSWASLPSAMESE